MSTVIPFHLSQTELEDYAAGRTPPEEVKTLEKHLSGCESCCKGLEASPLSQLDAFLKSSGIMTRLAATPGVWPNFPRYEVLGVAGEGGMGIVYKARHQATGLAVAVKVLREQFADNPEMRARFKRADVQITARLDHPNLVPVTDAGEIDGRPFVVMKWIEGQNLAQLVEDEGPLSLDLACDVIAQVCTAMQYLHECHITHRDIKPQNILLTPAPARRAYLLDFGLVRETGRPVSDVDLTQRGTFVGTPQFMSPEQARDAHEVDIRADIYSLGLVFYYLLVGQVPFPGRSGVGLIVAHQNEEPVPVSELRAGVPPRLLAVLKKMTAKKLHDRFQTPAEVLKALAAARRPRSRGWVKRVVAAAAVLAPLAVPVIKNNLARPATPEVENRTPPPEPLPVVGGSGQTPEQKNVRLTRLAWEAHVKGEKSRDDDKLAEAKEHYERAIKFAAECVQEFHGDAENAQKALSAAMLPVPEIGAHVGAEREAILKRGPLNDVCTCSWILGRDLARLKRLDDARKAYGVAVLLPHGMCWDKEQDSFWSPSRKAEADLKPAVFNLLPIK
jgi:serine/threonine protein kinase